MANTVSAASSPHLTLTLFGPCEVRVHGRPLPRLRTRKGLWLLALLTLRQDREVARSWLAGTLWPDSPETQSLANLRNSLKDLRRVLAEEAGRLVAPTSRTLSLDLAGAEVDVLAFDAAIARDDAATAVAQYRGPLLEGCDEEWVFQERQAREEAYLAALETLATSALAAGKAEEAARHLRQVIGIDPLRESAQRGLMEALAGGANYVAATEVYRELREHLHGELHAEPAAETTALYQRIRREARERAVGQRERGSTGARGNSGEAIAVSSLPLSLPRPPASALPVGAGTLTFLFTDIEGSTRLWEEEPALMPEAVARHDQILRTAIEENGGWVFKTVGDGFYAAFATAPEALAAALAAQRGLSADKPAVIRVRMALYTGTAHARDGDYFGTPLNRVARLLEAGNGGQILLGQTTGDLVATDLPAGAQLRDLGAHRLKDLHQPEHLYEVLHPDLPAEFPPLRSLEAFAHNLPRQLTSFIGREREIAEVIRVLSTTALATLTGSGGCGKTRLALQIAAAVVDQFPDGVWLVELAALSAPELLPQSVASALGLREEPGRSLSLTLVDYFRPRSLLLVLDNCEHLLGECANLVENLLHACPKLRILASSREGLGIAGEQTYRVTSLSLPDSQSVPPVEQLEEFEAVRLFADRARLSHSTFALTPANAASVMEICRRLDGIPLAIELAATRVKALPVEQLVKRLDDRFRLLTGGSRTALPRQQTLRALIDWSYDLLTGVERTLLRRLSVFAGGWSLEAAEVVCAGDEIEEWQVLDLLTQLVEKSLVTYQERDGAARYRLLETVRQYARDRLLEAGEAEAVRGRHLEFFLRLAKSGSLKGPEQAAMLERLEEEHDNLLLALEWSRLAEDRAEACERLMWQMWPFWDMRGRYSEGRECAERLLEGPGEIPVGLRACALLIAGHQAAHQCDYERARSFYEACLAIRRELQDEQGTAGMLVGLGTLGLAQGDYARARSYYEAALPILRAAGRHGPGLSGLGLVHRDQGDYASARLLITESLNHSRQAGNEADSALSLLWLGTVAWDQGDTASAQSLFGESLSIARRLGVTFVLVGSLNNLARAATARGDQSQARSLAEECLAVAKETGDRHGFATALANLASVSQHECDYRLASSLIAQSLKVFGELEAKREIAASLERTAILEELQGRTEHATRLFGAAEALREAIGAPLPPVDRPAHECSVAALRAALGAVPFAAAWAEGRALTLQQAVARAIGEPGAALPVQ